jgi:type I restriction enzyme, S subunit
VIEGLKPYAQYRDSGIPWLARIPAHWALPRTKHVLRERAEKGFPDEPLLAATQTKGVVRKELFESRTVVAMKDLHLLKLVRVGDFVISLRSFQGGIEYAREQGIISPAYTILSSRDPSTQPYLAWLFKSRPYIENLSLYVTGIRQGQNVDYERLSRSQLPLPPAEEREAIVHFLEHADRRIRRYIRTKQKLIKLLEEQKQAIVRHAVTRGLDPNVRLRPSGLEWLGDVPDHWMIARAGTVCELHSAKAHEHFVEPDGEFICVTARFVSTSGRSFRRCTRNLSPARRGDVLMVMSDLPRGRALARSYLVNDDRKYAVNQRVCILRPAGVHPQFLAFAVDRHPELLVHDDGYNQTHLPNAAFKIMRLPLPPFNEQAAIADYLVRTTVELESAANHAQREIDLLDEFRACLVTDVVTGKLDVGEAAAHLPREIDSADALQPLNVEAPSLGFDDDETEALEAGLQEA